MTDLERYNAAAHAMQSGVNAKMGYAPAETTPKHLRAGVNSAMSETAGLVTLLIEKGVFTKEEHLAAIADAMENEKALYETELSEHFDTKIVLA